MSQRTFLAERQPVMPYAQRNPSLEWRANWFRLSRSADERLLTDARDGAFAHKLDQIEKYGRDSGWLAGYDPAGAGAPWYPIGPRNVNGRVKALAVHPTDPNIVYAGAASGGVWKSTDGGQTWDSLWDMQESIAIGALGIAASSPSTVYAGTGEWTPGWGASYAGAGVFVSTDAGATWSRRAAVSSRRIGKLVVDPANAQRLWVCGDQGLAHSADGGVTWTTQRTGTITDVALDPANSNTVLIAVRYDGFYRSTDGGATFSLLPGAPTGAAVEWPQLALGVSGAHGHNFIVIKMGDTVQSSIDGGTTFNAVPGAHGGFYAGWNDLIAVAPDDEQVLIWGGVGLDRTANGGALWTSLPVHADQHAAVFAPSNTSVVYFANDGGVWRSDDKGATVSKVSNGLIITQFYNINFWSPLSNVIGGGAQDDGVNYTTSGLTWDPVYGGDGGWFVIDPTDPRTMYTESQYADVEKSTDGGASWAAKTAGIVGTTPWEGVLTMDPNNHLRLFFGTDRMLRSNDGLATAWATVSQVLNGEVSAIAVAPSDSNRVYSGTGSGSLYRSDDGGNTSPWADKTGTLPGRAITSIAVDSASVDTVMVSVGGLSGVASSQSVYRSTDGGSTWTDVSGDLPQVVGNSVVIDPSSPASTWYLATDTGIYRTTNGGTNWLPFDNGIPNVPVADLVVDSASKILYAGTMGRSAFKLDITPGMTKPQVDLYLRDDDEDTGERFPSPSNLPDPLLAAPGLAQWWMSPDIKVNHMPFFTPAGVFDGVVFDATLVHQDPVRGQTNRFYLQVSNRGWQATSNVSVRAFVADASAVLPNLPNALTPPNFDLTSTTNWQPVGPAQTIPTLLPNRPVIVSWDYAMPMATATHTCCLAVVSSADDPWTNPATDIATLITMDKRACLKNLHVVDPGPGPMPSTLTTINFHNPLTQEALIDIVIRPEAFLQGRIGLLLPKIQLAHPDQALQGVEVQPLAPEDPIGTWYGGSGDDPGLIERLAACDRTHIFVFDPTKPSQIQGIRLGPGQALRGVFASSLENDVTLTGPARFEVVQRVNGQVAGGSTYQFGYDLPAPGQTPQPHRLRIRSDELHWRDDPDGGRGSFVVAEVKLADDDDRTYQRILGDVREAAAPRVVFDGIVMEGESLTLVLIEAEEGDIDRPEELFAHRFDGGVRSWLGEHQAQGRDRVRFVYEIEEVPIAAAPGGD